jgi:uridine kinase
VECPASKVIIVEGIYALSDRLRPLQDLRVSISGGVHFDLVKRVMRDIDRSGQQPEDIIHQARSIHWFPYDPVRVVNADP